MTFRNAMLATLTLAGALAAQDPPSRVARLSLVNGPVSFQPASVDDWTAATPNYPLTTGDHLYTDTGAVAEVRIGPQSIRLAAQTNFGFLNLDDQTVQIRLTEGSVNIRVRALDEQGAWEVDTPNGAVSLLRAGDYRIDTDPNRNATMVTVRGGEAEVTANGQSFPVRARQTGYFSGDGRAPSLQNANPPDEFDRFAADRDRREDALPVPAYVSQNMVGYEDLNQYGSWEPESEYGPVWRPRVAAGWAPYHDGRWVWREPWGWTWVDEAPWGFAPFHYGRWAYLRGGWGWCPGPVIVARPVYAPALVAFVGGGGGFGVSLGGGVGWFPLGPREIYAPAYRVSPRYIREINVNRNITNVYVNRNVPGAFTAVSRQEFVSSRPVQRSSFQGREEFRSSPVAGFSPGIAPQRESLFGRTAGNVARPSQAVYDRQVIARRPPPAAPVSFSARQQALQENGGRPLAPEQINSLRRQGGAQPERVIQSGSPNQGFGRNSASPSDTRSFGRPQNSQDTRPLPGAPQAQTPPENRGFGRQAAPQSAPAPAAPPDNRGAGRSLDRLDSRPPQSAPRTDIPAENRGFGRNSPQQPARQAVPQATPQPTQQTTPQPSEPPAQRPAENRGFGRARESQQQPVPQATPQPSPQPNQQPAQRPAENRGFGRAAQPQAERPREERPKQEKQKDEKPKEERRFR